MASCRPVTASSRSRLQAPRPCSIMRPRFMPQLVRSTVIIHGCAFACVRQSLSANDLHREAQLVSSLSDVSTSNPSNPPAACQSTSEQLNPALVHPSHIPSITVGVSCLYPVGLPLHPRILGLLQDMLVIDQLPTDCEMSL